MYDFLKFRISDFTLFFVNFVEARAGIRSSYGSSKLEAKTTLAYHHRSSEWLLNEQGIKKLETSRSCSRIELIPRDSDDNYAQAATAPTKPESMPRLIRCPCSPAREAVNTAAQPHSQATLGGRTRTSPSTPGRPSARDADQSPFHPVPKSQPQ